MVVKDGIELDYAARGYDVVRNPRPEDGLSLSIRLGIQAARGDGIDAVLIALTRERPRAQLPGDMALAGRGM